MTTLTIKNPGKLDKFSFDNEKELFHYLQYLLELDFRELDDSEITEEMRNEIHSIDTTPLSEFTSIDSGGGDTSKK